VQAWDAIRGQLIPQKWAEGAPVVFDVLDFISDRPWYVWTIAGLCLLIALILEGAYHVSDRPDDNVGQVIQDLSEDARAALMRKADKMAVGAGAGDVEMHVLAELRMANVVEMRVVAAPPWPNGASRGTIDRYYLTAFGARVHERLLPGNLIEPRPGEV